MAKCSECKELLYTQDNMTGAILYYWCFKCSRLSEFEKSAADIEKDRECRFFRKSEERGSEHEV